MSIVDRVLKGAWTFLSGSTSARSSRVSGNDRSQGTATSNPDSVSFVTLNMERVNYDETKAAPDGPTMAEKRKALAATLRSAKGDVVGLQEVHSKDTLDQFLEESGLDEKYPHAQFYETNDNYNTHLAVLSRFPITDAQSHKDRTVHTTHYGRDLKLVRDIAEAEIQIGSIPTKAYVVHLKADPWHGANPGPEEFAKAEKRRLSEVGLLQKVIAEDLPGLPNKSYVVMGDINAEPHTPTGQTLLNGEAPLKDPHRHLSGNDAISHPATNRRLDVLFMSPEMDQHVVPGSAEILPMVENGSDHRAVKAIVNYSGLATGPNN